MHSENRQGTHFNTTPQAKDIRNLILHRQGGASKGVLIKGGQWATSTHIHEGARVRQQAKQTPQKHST